jgi:hypothetical protein
MGALLFPLSCSAMIPLRFGGRERLPDNSRFGEFNSRLGGCEFPVAALRELTCKPLIGVSYLAFQKLLRHDWTKIPGYFPGSWEFRRRGLTARSKRDCRTSPDKLRLQSDRGTVAERRR